MLVYQRVVFSWSLDTWTTWTFVPRLDDAWQDTWWPRFCPDTTRRRDGYRRITGLAFKVDVFPKIWPPFFFWKDVSYNVLLVIYTFWEDVFPKIFSETYYLPPVFWEEDCGLFLQGEPKKVHPWKNQHDECWQKSPFLNRSYIDSHGFVFFQQPSSR